MDKLNFSNPIHSRSYNNITFEATASSINSGYQWYYADKNIYSNNKLAGSYNNIGYHITKNNSANNDVKALVSASFTLSSVKELIDKASGKRQAKKVEKVFVENENADIPEKKDYSDFVMDERKIKSSVEDQSASTIQQPVIERPQQSVQRSEKTDRPARENPREFFAETPGGDFLIPGGGKVEKPKKSNSKKTNNKSADESQKNSFNLTEMLVNWIKKRKEGKAESADSFDSPATMDGIEIPGGGSADFAKLKKEEQSDIIKNSEKARKDKRKKDAEEEMKARQADLQRQKQEEAKQAELRKQKQVAEAKQAELRKQKQEAEAKQAELRKQKQAAETKQAELQKQKQAAEAKQAALQKQKQAAAQQIELQKQKQVAARQAELQKQKQVAAQKAELQKQKQEELLKDRQNAVQKAESEASDAKNEVEVTSVKADSNIINVSPEIKEGKIEIIVRLPGDQQDNSQNAPLLAHLYPKLVRLKTNEVASINKSVFKIGKEKTAVDYFINNNSAISRLHAMICCKEGRYFIVDTKSTNHTYINGVVCRSNFDYELSNGDTIKLANEEFKFMVQ